MSKYYSLFGSEISSGLSSWKDVPLCNTTYQLSRMDSDGRDSVKSSLSRTKSGGSSLWCPEESSNVYGSFPDVIFDSVINPPNSETQEEEYLDQVMNLDGFLHSDSGDGFEGLELAELADFSCPSSPFKMSEDFCEDVDRNNCDEFSGSEETYADENFDKQSRRSSSASSCISVASTKWSCKPSNKMDISSQNIVPEQMSRSSNLRRAVKNSSINNSNSKKLAVNVRRNALKSDDDEDEKNQYRSLPTRSTRKKVSNIILDENKNAVQARINREKKKAYISNLEQQVVNLKSENDTMRHESTLAHIRAESLSEEVAYLKAVLANQSALASLLKNINGDASMPVMMSSAFSNVYVNSSCKKRSYIEEHDYAQSQVNAKRTKSSSSKKEVVGAGVCLHVNNDRVTLEMCRHCSQKSDKRNS